MKMLKKIETKNKILQILLLILGLMPEDGSCFDVLTLRSSIDHISFQKK